MCCTLQILDMCPCRPYTVDAGAWLIPSYFSFRAGRFRSRVGRSIVRPKPVLGGFRHVETNPRNATPQIWRKEEFVQKTFRDSGSTGLPECECAKENPATPQCATGRPPSIEMCSGRAASPSRRSPSSSGKYRSRPGSRSPLQLHLGL